MGAQSDLPRFTKKEVENNRKYEEMPAVSMSAFPEGWTFGVMERQKSSTERASSTGSAQCRIFSRRRSYIPAAVPEVVRRRSWQRRKPSPQDSHKPQVTAADRKTWVRYVLENRPCSGLYGRLSGTYCSQVATRTPTWERHPFGTVYQSSL